MEKIINEYADAGQDRFFDINFSSCAPYCVLPYETIEDFNITEVGSSDLEQGSDEPFFGENIREAKAVLKDIFIK
jgi:hypothetical protein